MFYIICPNGNDRSKLIDYLNSNHIYAVFHYQSLHKSPFYKLNCIDSQLPNCDRYTNCLLRLPFYYELSDEEVEYVSKCINKYYI